MKVTNPDHVLCEAPGATSGTSSSLSRSKTLIPEAEKDPLWFRISSFWIVSIINISRLIVSSYVPKRISIRQSIILIILWIQNSDSIINIWRLIVSSYFPKFISIRQTIILIILWIQISDSRSWKGSFVIPNLNFLNCVDYQYVKIDSELICSKIYLDSTHDYLDNPLNPKLWFQKLKRILCDSESQVFELCSFIINLQATPSS